MLRPISFLLPLAQRKLIILSITEDSSSFLHELSFLQLLLQRSQAGNCRLSQCRLISFSFSLLDFVSPQELAVFQHRGKLSAELFIVAGVGKMLFNGCRFALVEGERFGLLLNGLQFLGLLFLLLAGLL